MIWNPGNISFFRTLIVKQGLYWITGSCLFVITGCVAQNNPELLNERKRQAMVKEQIQWRGITDSHVLEAMLTVPRHLFVPEPYTSMAYDDTPLPIGEGQTISQPYIVAYMTETLDLRQSDKVLEIGTGSGYQAAILAEICDSVFTIEIFESLAASAHEILDSLGYENIWIKSGDGYQGWPEHAPFDAIIVTCAPGMIPEPLQEQLAENGRMIIPVGGRTIQYLHLLVKKKDRIKERLVLPVRFVPMIDAEGTHY
ncbi:MAG: protein-L-isoaspartate(D-aspartate) O-methyltransferase [Bacteroidia bacterium]|nr:protein-L-isoaspartate(D-aspartate) O-methyltransferase [Bacteroidia bacterium]